MDKDTDSLYAALQSTDALRVSELAFCAGTMYAEAKMEVATLKSRRATVRMGVRDRLMGQGTDQSEAEKLGREVSDYLHYCIGLGAKERERDHLKILYKALRQRAWILGRREAAR